MLQCFTYIPWKCLQKTHREEVHVKGVYDVLSCFVAHSFPFFNSHLMCTVHLLISHKSAYFMLLLLETEDACVNSIVNFFVCVCLHMLWLQRHLPGRLCISVKC